MKCPNCGMELSITKRSGIVIEHCPQCRGLWLERSEVDKISYRIVAPVQAARLDDNCRKLHTEAKKKRKTFIEELFDF